VKTTPPTYPVGKLERGTVLDHLQAGKGLRALRALGLPDGNTVMMGMNLPSQRLGKKDIIKLDSYELTPEQAARVALISPDATLAIIRNYEVVQKIELMPPAAFRGLIRCTNPMCIVHEEGIPGSFVVEHEDPVIVRCEYCERSIRADQFEFA